TRRRLVRDAIQLATRSGADSTERAGLTSISASQKTSSPHASDASTSANISWNASSWLAPRRVCSANSPKSIAIALLKKDAEVFVQEHVGVEEDGALGDLPGAVHAAQHVFAAPGQELVIRFQVRAVDEEGRLCLHQAFGQRLRHEVADQMARA